MRNFLLFAIWLFIAATYSLYASFTTRQTEIRLDLKNSDSEMDKPVRAWDPYLPRPAVKAPETTVAVTARVGPAAKPRLEQRVAIAAQPPASFPDAPSSETPGPNPMGTDTLGERGENLKNEKAIKVSRAKPHWSIAGEKSEKNPNTLTKAVPNGNKVLRAEQFPLSVPRRKFGNAGLGLFALSGNFGRRGDF